MKKVMNAMDELYFWLRERVTEEFSMEGERYGIVMDSQILSFNQLGKEINRTGKMVGKYVRVLEKRALILTLRSAYGKSFCVKLMSEKEYFKLSIQALFNDIENRKEQKKMISELAGVFVD